MPKIQWSGLPPALRDHLFDRLRERKITVEDLYQLKLWRESEPEAPDGLWYKDFGSFKVCGEGKFRKTFLLAGQPATVYDMCKAVDRGMRCERIRLLEKAAEDYEHFARGQSDDLELEIERGRAYLRLGDVRRILNQTADAEKAYHSARRMFEGLSQNHAENLDVLLERANTALQDCLIERVRAGQCDAFRDSRRTVDTAFQGAATAPFGLPEERALLHAAWDQWRRAGDIGESVLAAAEPRTVARERLPTWTCTWAGPPDCSSRPTTSAKQRCSRR